MSDSAPADIHILREPRVYLVGRPSLVEENLARFFDDEGVNFKIKGREINKAQPERREWDADTDNAAELLCMSAGKVCYDAYGKGRHQIAPYLGNIIESGHGSVLEHATWNFIIAGVSRVFSHEHVRHRAGCAISQRSQRFVKENEAAQILLPLIEKNPEAKALWEEAVRKSQEVYDRLVKILTEDLKEIEPETTMRIKIVRSAARGVMPNCTETYIFWSANGRALRHYIEMRASKYADIEIRQVAIQILKIMQSEAPTIFGDYTIEDLPDGTQAASTPNTKV